MNHATSKMPHKKSNGKGFILFPIAFSVASYLLLFAVLAPALQPVWEVASLFFTSEAPDFNRESANIFKGTSSATNEDVSGKIPLSSIQMPVKGNLFGRLSIPGTTVDADLYYGDDAQQLRYGVGCYLGAFIPGYGRTTLIAGHNHTYFHTLGEAEIGDEIQIETNYGTYRYTITDTRIADQNDSTAYDLSKKEENLILYTCYPFDQIGLTPERYFVYAEYKSGPMLDIDN